MRPRSTLTALAALIGAASLIGCSSIPGGPAASSIQDPQFVTVLTPAAGTSSNSGSGSISGSGSAQIQTQVIDGGKGGNVNCGRFRLEIPAGAFSGSATISISVPNASVLRCHLGISPAGKNLFLRPVKLIVDYDGTNVSDASIITEAWFDEEGGIWRPLPGSNVDAERGTVTAPLTHFSEYGVVFLGKAGW